MKADQLAASRKVVSETSRLHSLTRIGARVIFVFYSSVIRLLFALMIPPDNVPPSPTCGRGAQPEGSGRVAETPLNDGSGGCSGLLPERPLRVSDRTRSLPECEGDPADPGV
jgi:hypothetical protein